MSSSKEVVHLTADDLIVLRAINRYQGLTAAMIQQNFFPGRRSNSVYRTLKRLVEEGLVEDPCDGPSNKQRPRDLPALYVLTREGRKAAASHLPVKAVSKSLAHHVVAVAEVGLTAERSGHKVFTDREIQYELLVWRQSSDPLPPFGLWLGGHDEHLGTSTADAQRRREIETHRPDLVVIEKQGEVEVRTAVEVERSHKGLDKDGRDILDRILLAYGRDDMFARVQYVVSDAKLQRYLEGRVRDLCLRNKSKFEFVPYDPRYSDWLPPKPKRKPKPKPEPKPEPIPEHVAEPEDVPWMLRPGAPGMW